jgi:hypothetical protein
MPFTPGFDIFYPCEADAIDCTIFGTFADSVQAALNTVDLLETQVLNRPTAKIVTSAPPQTFIINTNTNVQFQTEVFDNDSMVNLAVNNDRITINTAGVYLVQSELTGLAGFTTLTSEASALTQNGTVRYRKKKHFPADVPLSIQTIGLFNCQVADIIRLTYLWTGTGGPATIANAELTATLLTLP